MVGRGPRAVALKAFKKELKEEAALEDELLQHSGTIQAVRLQELRWKAEMKPLQKILYGLNQLKTLAQGQTKTVKVSDACEHRCVVVGLM